jgi:uncharacterized protein
MTAPPTTPRQRDDLADELRGLALLGIVTVNAPFIAISASGFTDTSVANPIDRTAVLAVLAFAQAKFYLIFSLLFGYSMSYLIKDNSPEQRSALRRRLFGLAVLGLLHGWLFFAGDILLLYAAMGCVLLLLVGHSNNVVFAVAAFSAMLWAFCLLAVAFAGAESAQAQRELQGTVAAVDAALRNGNFWQAVKARFEFWPVAQTTILLLNGFAVLSLFCFGLVAGRAQVLRYPERYLRLWHSGLWLGATIGVPGALISSIGMAGSGASFGVAGARETIALAVGFVTAPALSMGYVSAIALLHNRRPDVFRIFRPAGRMSLTGYIAESVLLAVIFCGFGFGLMGQLGAGTVTLTALGVWLILDLFAHQWQKRFDHGPLESLLRRWSRGRRL